MNTGSLKTFLLVAVREFGTFGISEERLLTDARREGFATLTAPELTTLLRECADASWIHRYEPPLGTPRWRIGELGRSVLREAGV